VKGVRADSSGATRDEETPEGAIVGEVALALGESAGGNPNAFVIGSIRWKP
jgi:hypothetical protein